MEYLTNLWNNQPNILIGGSLSTLVLLGIYIKLLDDLSVKINSQGWSLIFSMGAIMWLLLI